MKEINDLIALYEETNQPKIYYYYYKPSGYRESIFLFDSLLDSDNVKYETIYYGEPKIKRMTEFTGYNVSRFNNHIGGHQNYIYYRCSVECEYVGVRVDGTLIKLNKDEHDYILDNNITDIDEVKAYLNVKRIKDPNSTMMDVLCAFGDL